ncbi:MAG: TrkH family potassium uptake protein [Alphaproteobacteria bacterium]|nr:TrkH family potassium uptake protein [Alphaproteobacteria bacterium]MBE8219911.1 TrkH family potassium uptake protein [Alphaproteobacteria bacterium]
MGNSHSYKTVFFIIGTMLAALAVGMIIPAIADVATGDEDWRGFLVSAAFTGFIAVALILTNRGDLPPLSAAHAFLLTGLTWIALAAFAALPLAFSRLDLSYTNAFFEAMSGLTTTGATVIIGLEEAPPSILLWRALLQWFGGIGIIVTAISVLPLLNVGGMQLFRLENSDTSEKILPRTAQLAGSIGRLYVIITGACACAYFVAGMSVFDATTHAMTTIATGGFSTHDDSFAAFDSAAIEYVAIIFMIVASLPFVAYLQITNNFTREKVRGFFEDAQIRMFFALVALCIITLWAYQIMAQVGGASGEGSGGESLRYAAFNATSILTGTGYVSTNYSTWGGFAIICFFLLSFIGGCAGSTACGLKIFRVQILFKTGWRYVRQLSFPNGVFIIRYNGRLLDDATANSITAFIFIFFLTFAFIAVILSLMGLEPLTALSASAAAIANVGPGLGEVIGPTGTYTSLPDGAKWLLAAGMLLGRLEFLTILVMLTPEFWRR